MSHITTIEDDPAQTYAGVAHPRCRWACSCGQVGAWHPRTKNAAMGAAAHASRLARGKMMGRMIEEHW